MKPLIEETVNFMILNPLASADEVGKYMVE